MSDARVEQYFRFFLGIIILGPLAIGFLADQLNGKTFTVDPFYAGIVGAVITYFFTSGASSQTANGIANITGNPLPGSTAAANSPDTVTAEGPSSRGTQGGASNG